MSAGLKIAVVAGEESGDVLAADLIRYLKEIAGCDVQLIGTGGDHLAALGQRSLIDPEDISIKGISAVLTSLPKLLGHIRNVSAEIVRLKPDAMLIVDNPDFTHRVAKRVRARLPNLPIVDLVCPQVWAWRHWRAKAMRSYVDHVLCLLPFEPEALERLNGPSATYVGHRLAGLEALRHSFEAHRERPVSADPVLLLLPGSRSRDAKVLLPRYRRAVEILEELGYRPKLVLPTVSRIEPLIREIVADWPYEVDIVSGEEVRHEAFERADVALAASGTVTLELALAGLPFVSTYRIDRIAWWAHQYIPVWSTSLPNLVADRPVIPELHDFDGRASNIAREIARLLESEPARAAQKDGFAEIRRRMETSTESGKVGATILLDLIRRRDASVEQLSAQ
ncbi:lipid-A-disaccharide synthase [Notoacmeibacter sp. MSK16QG-6]|uniref:lipid-A-disaccharide synthase n=1 Tax=Notoacmeibacter sp. MSK16QG-6 TaxID=2957982 RepID=UPI00209FE12C|nr:lipid-A-disaccharide synthase [Notoacmeibacter sp. MSK16QG-6]MCP1199340.1 lipid-A-disaccharide synthase [Notoacmeibacter sp. MSK16QG-6]